MSNKKPPVPSPENLIKADRRRLAAEDGARAMAEIEQHASAVRKNMERLRELRLAKETSGAADPALAVGGKKKPKRTPRIIVR